MKNKHTPIVFLLLLFFSSQSQSGEYFQEWCDTFTAESLVSLAANRIFGNISSLDDKGYKARSEWVSSAYIMAEERFKKVTGHDFMGYERGQPDNWVARCQLEDQIE